ncbi:hypothetical protein C8J27_103195 [Rhodobacter aestuarii]|uniref:Uncharacterized protein n=1 Tax=Rhodobacter aestuarii TaxID=453582 RepID=A0A1N7K404_9RHOB|nr:hypothetical protein [Rhodobacter aestuarii]PTV95866.1 hypothetical protein C8J27_103195 [Rhodobacter aestuarii]SIS56333.1 hypothetical protein SAMN05421580_102239 [Rhodobacter aestuarii]
MTTQKVQPFFVRCFIDNPGGAYDPAPLHQFDHYSYCPPAVGDRLQEGRTGDRVYVVTQRHFHIYGNGHENCALLIELADPSPLDRV